MAEQSGFGFFVLGLGVGVAAGMLLAPHSGEETRGFIKSKTDEGKEYLKQRAGDIRDSASELVDRSKEAVGRQKDQLAQALEAGKQAYRETVQENPMPGRS